MTDEERKRIGRPPLPAEARRDRTIRVRATADEVAEFEAVGGNEWFRRTLRRAVARLKEGKPATKR